MRRIIDIFIINAFCPESFEFMRTLFRFIIAVCCSGAGLASTASGAFLTGQVGMMGKATLDTPLITATEITAFGRARVGYGMGDFDVPGTIAVNTPVTFAPFSLSDPLSGPLSLWEFTAAGSVYSFELHELSFDCFEFGGNSFMNLSGFGYVSIDGTQTTPAEFCFSTQQSTDSTSMVVTWSAETILLSVPEGGFSWISLLLGILGIEVFRRRHHNGAKWRASGR